MRFGSFGIAMTAVAVVLGAAAARADDDVVIGDIDDLSGVYADVIGQGGIEAMNMAVADFGGSVLGKKIVTLSADHQNKPDIGASKFVEWADQNHVNMILGGSNSGVSIAMSKKANEKKVPFIAIGAAGASLSNADCNAYTVHYGYDTTALANGTATTIVKGGAKKWFFLTADYAFGTQLQDAATKVVTANGGTVIGSVRVPLGASDFSSFLLQAQSSGADVLGLANAGNDTSNSLKAAQEFGLTKTMKPAALLAFLTDIHSVGIEGAQGLILTDAWYWDQDEDSRAWAKRFFDKIKREPTWNQAAYYSATLHFLNAVKEVGSTDPDKVMAQMKADKVNDMFAKGGYIRADGLLIHDMAVMQVKTPAESKGEWDLYKKIATMKGEDAYGPITGLCPLAPKG